MIGNLLVWTVLVPLVLGLVLGLFSRFAGSHRALAGGLLFLVAVLLVILVEGAPVFPPVAGKQKLPFALAGLAVAFLIAGTIRRRINAFSASILALVVTGAPALWVGYRLLAANPAKAGLVAAILAFFAVMAALFFRGPDTARSAGPSPLIGLLFVFIATAVVSVTGGYIGLAQVSGALAAVTGGWLLVSYVALMRGDEAALDPGPEPRLAFLVLSGLVMVLTTLFAPSANPVALGLAALPLAVIAWLGRGEGSFVALAPALRPVLSGVLSALPALAAILVSVFA